MSLNTNTGYKVAGVDIGKLVSDWITTYYAPLDSPTFTGEPKAPTPTPATDSSTKIATTEFVKNQAYAPLASPGFTGTPTAPTPTASDNNTNIATTKFVKDQAYAPLASPGFTGTPTTSAPATSDSSTQIATTKFVKDQGYLTSQKTYFKSTWVFKNKHYNSGDKIQNDGFPWGTLFYS